MARVTLTFDNGPEPEVTQEVLDTLARRDLKAMFFVVGEKLALPDGRAATERAHGEGHWIANHSYTHSISLGDSDDPGIFDAEVTRTQELIGELAHPDKLFRPFCNAGQVDRRVFKRAHVQRLLDGGYTCVMFDPVVNDWDDAEGWVDRALALVRSQPWTTLVLHDIVGYPDGTVNHGMRHLDRFLDTLVDEGHELVQELEPRVLPIVRGTLAGEIEHLCN